jgi:hypothetical protein
MARGEEKAGGEKTKIAVLNLKLERGLDEGLVKLLNELLLTEFQRTGKFKVIGGSDLESMLKLEHKKQMLQCNDTVCLAEIGGALGVEKLAVANIGKIGSLFLVNVKILDVRKAEVEARVSYKVKGIEDKLVRAITNSVRELVGAKPLEMSEQAVGMPAASHPEAEVSTKHETYNLWGHVALWSGAGLLTFGGIATALSASAADDYKGGDRDADDRSMAWARVMYAGFSIGTALVATGVVLWLLAPDGDSSHASATVVPTAEANGLVFSIRGSW